jgi:hypothetical protein
MGLQSLYLARFGRKNRRIAELLDALVVHGCLPAI